MTKNELLFKIQTNQNIEFKFNNKTYSLSYDKASDGSQIILFGQVYEEKRYESFGELMNKAKIDNYFLKEILEDI